MASIMERAEKERGKRKKSKYGGAFK